MSEKTMEKILEELKSFFLSSSEIEVEWKVS